jgi:hypothetical protein
MGRQTTLNPSNPINLVALLACAAALLTCTGCAANGSESAGDARLADRWQQQASAPHAPYRAVFVVGVAHTDALRRMFEDEFTRQLQGQNVKGIASYRTMPPGTPMPAEVVGAVRASGADAVIVTRLLKREQWRRGSFGPSDYQSHYRAAAQSIYVPQAPIVYDTEVVTLETRLFDAGREQMVWATTTELFDPRATEAQVARLVRAIVKDLQRATLI